MIPMMRSMRPQAVGGVGVGNMMPSLRVMMRRSMPPQTVRVVGNMIASLRVMMRRSMRPQAVRGVGVGNMIQSLQRLQMRRSMRPQALRVV
ncbi:MAG: hypothetical protein ACPGWR_15695 [Ardenticatenaceae bacterium]